MLSYANFDTRRVEPFFDMHLLLFLRFYVKLESLSFLWTFWQTRMPEHAV